VNPKDAVTVPAMPAAKRKSNPPKHTPTLIFKMPAEVQEEKDRRERGRYSIIPPRDT
jgi:hypothetical protein